MQHVSVCTWVDIRPRLCDETGVSEHSRYANNVDVRGVGRRYNVFAAPLIRRRKVVEVVGHVPLRNEIVVEFASVDLLQV